MAFLGAIAGTIADYVTDGMSHYNVAPLVVVCLYNGALSWEKSYYNSTSINIGLLTVCAIIITHASGKEVDSVIIITH